MAKTKADALAAAKTKADAAVARWSAAVPREAKAYEATKTGDQFSRLEHALELDELRAARLDTLDAEAALQAAAELPEDPA